LRIAYAARGEVARVELQIVPGLGHQFGPDAKTISSQPASHSTELGALIEKWFQEFLAPF
jgi:hypothetical protein